MAAATGGGPQRAPRRERASATRGLGPMGREGDVGLPMCPPTTGPGASVAVRSRPALPVASASRTARYAYNDGYGLAARAVHRAITTSAGLPWPRPEPALCRRRTIRPGAPDSVIFERCGTAHRSHCAWQRRPSSRFHVVRRSGRSVRLPTSRSRYQTRRPLHVVTRAEPSFGRVVLYATS